MVCMRLGNTRCDRAHTHLSHQFHADPRLRVGIFKIVDQLGQIFDGIDIVVRRWTDQANPRG